MMVDSFFRFFLAFSHEQVLIPVIILGYIWISRPFFFQLACLTLTSMLCNVALKSTFGIPLSPLLKKEGFAFPSGHMQTATVFYGWFFQRTKNQTIKLLIILLLIGIAAGLIYFGYHNERDVIAAVFVGLFLLFLYRKLTKRSRSKWIACSLLILSTLFIGYTGVILTVPAHAWMAYYTLIGLIISDQFLISKQIQLSVTKKVVATTLCLLILFSVRSLFSFLEGPAFVWQSQWLLIGSAPGLSLWVCGKKMDRQLQQFKTERKTRQQSRRDTENTQKE